MFALISSRKMPLETTAYYTIDKNGGGSGGVFKYKKVTCKDLATDVTIDGMFQHCAPCNVNCKTCATTIEDCQECQTKAGYDAFYSSWTTWKLFTQGIDDPPYTMQDGICKQNCSGNYKSQNQDNSVTTKCISCNDNCLDCNSLNTNDCTECRPGSYLTPNLDTPETNHCK
jgi:hypothetical protein